MKKCAVIGASGEAIHAIKTAQNAGYHVVALDGCKCAEGFRVADEAVVADIRDADEIVRILQNREVSFLLPVPVGRWLTTFGAVNDRLGLTGIGLEPIRCSVDKWLFHQKLSSEGLRNIQCKIIRKKSDIEQIDYFPCVVKPRYGSGSRLVFSADTSGELRDHAKSLDYSEDYLVEEKLLGKEYGLDGAVIQGKLQIILLREKINTPPPFCQCIGYYSVPLDKDSIYQAVHEKMSKVIAYLQIDNCVMHADLMIGDGTVSVIELSPRPSGHGLHNLFTPLATGIDIIQEYIKFVEQKEYSFVPAYIQPMLIRFFDFSGCTITKVPDEAVVKDCFHCIDYKCNIKPGDKMGQVTDDRSIIGRGHVILSGTSFDELTSGAGHILEMFERRDVHG